MTLGASVSPHITGKGIGEPPQGEMCVQLLVALEFLKNTQPSNTEVLISISGIDMLRLALKCVFLEETSAVCRHF